MHYSDDDFEHLVIKHDIKDIDMSHYSNEKWFNEIYDYLELIMTPADPKPPEKPLTKDGKIKQKARVKNLIRIEFGKRFPDLLERGLDL